jgi:hypothetical protein
VGPDASVASLLLTTEAAVSQMPDVNGEASVSDGGAGMSGMY